MSPLLLTENLIHPFNFYWNSKIQQGMRHNARLYTLAHSFSSEKQLEAYQLSYQLAEAGKSVVVTVSQGVHKIWVGLKASCDIDMQLTA